MVLPHGLSNASIGLTGVASGDESPPIIHTSKYTEYILYIILVYRIQHKAASQELLPADRTPCCSEWRFFNKNEAK